MRAGRLRNKVTFQRRSTTKSDTGNPVDTWTDLYTCSAALEPKMGREFYTDSGEHARLITDCRVRYATVLQNLTPHDRVVDRSQSPQVVYDIESVKNHRERNRELLIELKRNG